MHTAIREKVGYRRQQKSTWFDEACRQTAIEKNDAYQTTLKSAAISAAYERYCEQRRKERHLFHRKKHEFVKAECEAADLLEFVVCFCKDQDGNMVADIRRSMSRAFECHTAMNNSAN